MAKGKHATAAAGRRLEAATDHIDRLTDKLAETKMRMKAVEKDAARVPGMERELDELRAIVSGTEEHRLTADVAELRDKLREERQARKDEIAKVRKVVLRVLRSVWLVDSDAEFSLLTTEWDELAEGLHLPPREILMALRGEPLSFLQGTTSPLRELVEARRQYERAPISRESWANTAIAVSVRFLQEPTDGNWDELVKSASALAAEGSSAASA